MNEIWLDDLARCLDALDPRDRATAHAVARALGLGVEEVEDRRAPVASAPTGVRRPSSEKASVETPHSLPATIDLEALPVLTQVSGEDTATEFDFVAADALEAEPPDEARRPPRHEPLFEPRWTRELLASALATTRYDGPVDGVRLVDTIARGRVVTEVPRLPRPTLSRGAQLLVDVGDAMDPFVQDRRELAADLINVVGSSLVTMLFFRDAPTRGVGVGRVWSSRYEPPEPGVPVLVLTDLGIGGPGASQTPSSEREWFALHDVLRPRGSRLVALVPYNEERWPRRLAQKLTIVRWDRATTASVLHARMAPTTDE